MKNIPTFFAMAVLSTLSMNAMTSCSNDATLEISKNELQGIWMHDDRTDNDYNYIQFNADGTGAKWEIYKNAPDARPHDYETFTFTISGNKITFYETDGDRDIETIKMKNANTIVIDRDKYTRQKQ